MLISSPEEKYEAKLIAELGDELQPMSTPGMAVFTLRLENGCFCYFLQVCFRLFLLAQIYAIFKICFASFAFFPKEIPLT